MEVVSGGAKIKKIPDTSEAQPPLLALWVYSVRQCKYKNKARKHRLITADYTGPMFEDGRKNEASTGASAC